MRRQSISLALGAATLLSALTAPASAATVTISVGASPSLANALVDVIGAFTAYYFTPDLTYNIAVTVDTNENLKAQVAASSTTGPFDLILTDDSSLGKSLTQNYSAFVEGSPFVFAYDRLTLYSITADVGKVLTGLPARFSGTVVVPDPQSDAYGRQAANLLAEIPWFITKIPSSRVDVQPDVATVRAGVEVGVYPYGILAKSAICTNPAGTEVYPEGSYHHEYPPLLGFRYQRIALSGVKIALAGRSADQATELAAFVDFLNGVGTPQGTDVLKRYCYALPR